MFCKPFCLVYFSNFEWRDLSSEQTWTSTDSMLTPGSTGMWFCSGCSPPSELRLLPISWSHLFRALSCSAMDLETCQQTGKTSWKLSKMQQPEGSLLSVLLRYKIKIFNIKKIDSYLKASFVHELCSSNTTWCEQFQFSILTGLTKQFVYLPISVHKRQCEWVVCHRKSFAWYWSDPWEWHDTWSCPNQDGLCTQQRWVGHCHKETDDAGIILCSTFPTTFHEENLN